MGYKIKFDMNGIPITPTLILAKKSGEKIGVLPAQEIKYKDNFNSNDELSFYICKVNNGQELSFWEEIVDFKLLYAVEYDAWFEINVSVDEKNETIKNISAVTLGEVELSQINLYGFGANTEEEIEFDDYSPTIFYNETDKEHSLLDRIFDKAPHYSIGSVPTSLKRRQRTFSFDGDSIYNALQDISEELDCWFDFSIHSDSNGRPIRKINVYDLEDYCPVCDKRGNFTVCPNCGNEDIVSGYGEDSRVLISTDLFADEITYSVDADSVKNCFRMAAGDDLMTAVISSVNDSGSNYIWYITDEQKSQMSAELRNALNEFDNQTETTVTDNTSDSYNALVSKYNNGFGTDFIAIPNTPLTHDTQVAILYSAIDFDLYLRSGLLPSTQNDDTNAVEQGNKIVSNPKMNTIAIPDNPITEATLLNYILLYAKSFVDTRYQVKIASSSVTQNGDNWTATVSFTVTNYYNEEDTYTTSSIVVFTTKDYVNYEGQLSQRALSADNKTKTDIVSLFDLDENDFIAALKYYSLDMLTSFLKSAESARNLLIEQGCGAVENTAFQVYNDYTKRIGYISSEIDVRNSEIATVSATQEKVQSWIIEYQHQHNLQTFLENKSPILWTEFSSFRREDTYENQNYISDGLTNSELIANAIQFIEVAKKDIKESATAQHTVSASLKNLLAIEEFKPFLEHFEVGNWVRVQCDGEVFKLRLLDFEISYSDLSKLSVQFSDVKRIESGVYDIKSVLNSSKAISSTYSNTKRQAEKGKTARSLLDGWTERGLDLSSVSIINKADSQDFVFDGNGMLFRKFNQFSGEYEPEQLKIINSTIAFTDNAWNSVKTAIGKIAYINPATNEKVNGYGINAGVVIGKMILGENLGIYNSGATLKFDNNGLIITNDDYTFDVSPNKDNIVRVYNSGGVDSLRVAKNGDTYVKGEIVATTGEIGAWSLTGNRLYNGNFGLNANDNIVGDSLVTANTKCAVRFYAGDNGSVDNSTVQKNINAKCYLLDDGSLYVGAGSFEGYVKATSGEFTGKITSTEGEIGGFTIKRKYIAIGKTSYSETTNDGVYIGTTGIGLGKGKFYVTDGGSLHTEDGNIGGFTIKANRLYSTNVGISSQSSGGYAFWAGNSANPSFYVTHGGVLNATGATISGHITATSLTLGSGVKLGISDINGLQSALDAASSGTDLTGYICVDGTIGTKPSDGATGFVVSKDGLLQASNAIIYGDIYASNGRIGGLQISSNSIHTNSMSLSASGLTLDSENAKLTIGNLFSYYDTANKRTLLGTSGVFYIFTGENLSSSSTYIGLYTDSTGTYTDVITYTISYSYTNNGGAGSARESYLNITLKAEMSMSKSYRIESHLYGEFSYTQLSSSYDSSFNESLIIQAGNRTATKTIQLKKSGLLSEFSNFKLKNWKETIGNVSGGTNTHFSETRITRINPENIVMKGHIKPATSNTYDLGGYSKAWKDLYIAGTAYNATGSVVDVSDYNKKNTISEIDEKYSCLFDSILPVSFKYNDGTSGRLHLGFIAQDVKRSMEESGLTTKDFAGYCEWSDDVGRVVCGLRYGEFIPLNTYEIQKLKHRVAELEQKIEEITVS